MTASLLLSWFAAQLGWTVVQRGTQPLVFTSASGASVQCQLVPDEGSSEACISRVKVRTDGLELDLSRESNAPLLLATISEQGKTNTAHYPAANTGVENLLTEELIPGAKHRVYLKALQLLETVL